VYQTCDINRLGPVDVLVALHSIAIRVRTHCPLEFLSIKYTSQVINMVENVCKTIFLHNNENVIKI